MGLHVAPTGAHMLTWACQLHLLTGQFALGLLLGTPVPGAPPATIPLPHSLFGGLSLKSTVSGAMADPGLAWVWGALAGAALVVLMARFPDPDAGK